MTLGYPIQVRLSPEKQTILEDEAARKGKKLATYLRERLEAEHDVYGELTSLRRELANLHHTVEDLLSAVEPRQADGGGRSVIAIQIETLLLLRSIAGPDRMKTIRGELKRLGYDVWTQDGKGE